MPVEISETITKSEYDGLDSKKKAIFKAVEDDPNQYVFDDVSSLRQSYHNEKKRADTVNDEFNTFKNTFKDIDPEKYKELSSRKDLLDKQLSGESITKEEHERRVKSMKDDYEGKLSTLDNNNKALDTNYSDLLFENQVIKKLQELEVDEYGMKFLPNEIRRRVKFDTDKDTGKKLLIPLDDKGEPLFDNRGDPADIGFLVEVVVDENDRFVPGRHRGGTGSKSNNRTTDSGGKRWSELSDTEKSMIGDRGGKPAINHGISRKLADHYDRKQKK